MSFFYWFLLVTITNYTYVNEIKSLGNRQWQELTFIWICDDASEIGPRIENRPLRENPEDFLNGQMALMNAVAEQAIPTDEDENQTYLETVLADETRAKELLGMTDLQIEAAKLLRNN